MIGLYALPVDEHRIVKEVITYLDTFDNPSMAFIVYLRRKNPSVTLFKPIFNVAADFLQ